MLVAISEAPNGLENAKLLYNLSGGNNMGGMAQAQLAAMPGLGYLGSDESEAKALYDPVMKADPQTTGMSASYRKAIEKLMSEGKYKYALTYLKYYGSKIGLATATKKVILTDYESAAPSTAGKRTSTLPEQMDASNRLIQTLLSPFVKQPERPQEPSPEGRPQKPETDWTTYALIGGGILLAGAVTFALVKASKKKGRK